MTSNITPLEQFDCEGDPANIGVRWEKWKRGLQIYLEAAEIDDAIRKRAVLLHTGGLGLQEIYYNIPGAHIDEDSDDAADVDVYEVALKKLNDYFSPKQSRVYERHVFRQIKQKIDEKFEKFLVRLRKQADKCDFKDQKVKEENLIDQTVEKCISTELRKKILKEGDSFTLQDVIEEANILESVKRQLQEFDTKDSSNTINKILVKDQETSNSNRGGRVIRNSCSRCGSSKHISNDTNCPARDVVCRRCGFKGHFMKNCRSRRFKRSAPQNTNAQPVKKFKTNSEKVHCVND